MPSGNYTERSPLKPPVLHILLALAEGESHGLGIADRVEAASGGVVTLGPGTLYRSLDEMQEAGMIQRIEPREEDADPRRKYYCITRRGQAALRTEMERFEELVEIARARNVLARGA